MGAADSEVGPTTREVIVESANFRGPRIRRSGIALGLRSEASSRHERGLPPELADAGAQRAAQLLIAQGARAAEPFAVGAEPGLRPEIAVAPAAVTRLLGIALTPGEVAGALRSLGFSVSADSDAALRVTPPYWRSDVTLDADVVEEVARIVGYDRIAAAQPLVADQAISSADYQHERSIAHALAAGGYREAITLSLQPLGVYQRFVSVGVAPVAAPIEIRNPLSEDQRFMRFSLLAGLLQIVAEHESSIPLRLFEIGHVFERGGSERDDFEVVETAWVYAARKREEPAWHDAEFLTFKGEAQAIVRAITGRDAESVTGRTLFLHPGKTGVLIVAGKDVATVGAVDPRLLAAYGIEQPVYAGVMRNANVPAYAVPRYRPASRFPSVERDLALVVAPELPAAEVEHAVAAAGGDVVRRCAVFDEYRGPQVSDGRKSLAVRVTFQREDATLTDAEVDGHVARILAGLRERFGAEIRE
jgi:phenylalanyl-tRNA synthetase beta chain